MNNVIMPENMDKKEEFVQASCKRLLDFLKEIDDYVPNALAKGALVVELRTMWECGRTAHQFERKVE